MFTVIINKRIYEKYIYFVDIRKQIKLYELMTNVVNKCELKLFLNFVFILNFL